MGKQAAKNMIRRPPTCRNCEGVNGVSVCLACHERETQLAAALIEAKNVVVRELHESEADLRQVRLMLLSASERIATMAAHLTLVAEREDRRGKP